MSTLGLIHQTFPIIIAVTELKKVSCVFGVILANAMTELDLLEEVWSANSCFG